MLYAAENNSLDILFFEPLLYSVLHRGHECLQLGHPRLEILRYLFIALRIQIL